MTMKQNLSDEELMCLYRDGDETAFNSLYSRYSSRVYGFLHKKLRDPQASNEVFQAVFTKLHRSRQQYNQSFPFAPWLFTIARNAMLDYLRSGQATERARAAYDQAEDIRQTESPEPKERIELGSLPESQRTAIELRYYDDLPFEEIAKRLETSPTNVRQLVSRGLRQLKTSLQTGATSKSAKGKTDKESAGGHH